jgi:DNA-binding helix-hairpin-helix protein with protein kinase domain
MTRLLDSFGKAVVISERIQAGGEGTVSAVAGDPQVVAKMFHEAPSERLLRKLVAMVRMRTAELDRAAAWPIDLLKDGSGTYRGFIMRRMEGHIVDSVLHPGMQRVHYPAVTYEFLFHVAVNLMDAASSLHSAGVVIGDVNERNVIVRPDGTVRFIDADSFQISLPDGTGLCLVGTPTYTPPELQGADFTRTVRTPNHDNFGLAVLLFQILMLGRHPFSGVPRSANIGGSIDEAIRASAYAYSTRHTTALAPPPGSLMVRSLGGLASLFEEAFHGKDRPTSQQWVGALRGVRGALRRCPANPRHAIVREVASCGLCSLPRDLMPAVSLSGTAAANQSVEDLLRQATQLLGALRLSSLFREGSLGGTRNQLPELPPWLPAELRDSLQSGKRPRVLGAWLSAVALLAVASAILSFGSLCGLFALVVGIGLLKRALQLSKDRKRFDEVAEDCRRYSEARVVFLRDLSALDERERVARESETRRLGGMAQAEQRIRQAAAALRTSMNRAVSPQSFAAAEHAERWRSQQLETRFVAQAGIPGIGAERTAVLQSFGIESAADVSEEAIRSIPGFGEVLAGRLVAWRKSMEREIACLSPPPLPAADTARAVASASDATLLARRDLAQALSDYSAKRIDSDNTARADAEAIDEARRALSARMSALRAK